MVSPDAPFHPQEAGGKDLQLTLEQQGCECHGFTDTWIFFQKCTGQFFLLRFVTI